MNNNKQANTRNPMIKRERLISYSQTLHESEFVSQKETLKKSIYAIAFTTASAIISTKTGYCISIKGILMSIILSAIIAQLVYTKPIFAKYLIFPYSAIQGGLVGGLLNFTNSTIINIAIQSLFGTFIICGIVLYVSWKGMIKITSSMVRNTYIACLSILCLFVLNITLSLLGFNNPFPKYIYGNGIIGIIFSAICIALAISCLFIDIDIVKECEKHKYAKSMEWYLAFSILASAIWVYMEMLNLLLKLQVQKKK